MSNTHNKYPSSSFDTVFPEVSQSGFDITEFPQVEQPIFRVGSHIAQERLMGERRVLIWEPNGNEFFGMLAGWEGFPHKLADDRKEGLLEIPEGTRNAQSVLSGVEGWEQEKPGIVDWVIEYSKHSIENFGAIDTSVTFKGIGIAPDGETIFVPPPHNAETQPQLIESWKANMVYELGELLQRDPDNSDLINYLEEGLRELREP